MDHSTTSHKDYGITTFCLQNVQSLRNKASDICEFILEHEIDILAVTESWLKPCDSHVIGESTPTGYTLKHVPRTTGRAGGVAIVYKDCFELELKPKQLSPKSFEYMETMLKAGSEHIRLVVLYRPPRSPKNKLTKTVFLQELSELLELLSTSSGKLLLVGDFNFHLDDVSDLDTRKLVTLLESVTLSQHIHEPTHKSGHTLDLVITRSSDNFVNNITVKQHLLDCVHFPIFAHLSLEKKIPVVREIEYRKIRAINVDHFRSDLKCHLSNCDFTDDTKNLCDVYNAVIKEVVDQHAPLRKRKLAVRDRSPWISDEIQLARRNRRKAERKWRATRLTIHRDIYKEQRHHVTELIKRSKTEYYSQLVDENSSDQKALFRIINTLLHHKQQQPLPAHTDLESLANNFGNYFTEKIEKIQEHLHSLSSGTADPEQTPQRGCAKKLEHFTPATEEEVKRTIQKAPEKSCGLDPLPTGLLKQCLEEMVPYITAIVNKSLSSGCVPAIMKQAVVIPLLKKTSLQPDFKNYRPVSNLSFISKILERVVASRLLKHLEDGQLLEKMQSAYRPNHSTETALVRVQNDILMNMEQQEVTILVLLDLSAAFDTVHHKTLLNHLEKYFGLTGTVLQWFQSYLEGRQQSVSVNGTTSKPQHLTCGVPQGSVLGPILFTMYTHGLGHIMRKHNMEYHFYADDSQIYISASPSQDDLDTSTNKIGACVEEVRLWMAKNHLKLNDDKTEVLILGTKQQRAKVTPKPLKIGNAKIPPSQKPVRNIGALFDADLTMEDHVKKTCQTCYFHLRNIGKIRKFLNKEATESLVHALITSRLDWGNALLVGVSNHLLDRLQMIQNVAARVIMRVRKYDHITPVLKKLHWLPIRERITFKLLLLTYKAQHNMAPSYLSDLLTIYQPIRSLRSESKGLLCIPKTKSKTLGARAFSIAAPTHWNALPENIRSAPTVDTFKSRLKKFLFEEYYGH